MAEEDRRGVPESSGQVSQNHKGVDTRDVDSPRRYQSAMNTDEEERDVKPFLWCSRCHRERKKKKCHELELKKSTRRLLERIKKRRSKCGKPDDDDDDDVDVAAVVDDKAVVAGVSSAPHRESISRRSAPEKSKRSRKQDAAEAADKDIAGRSRRERRRRVRREDDEEERRRRERRTRRERREKREERIPRVADAPSPAATPADFLKSCCYLCAQNTLAITAAAATAGLKPEQSDKAVQVSAHKLHAGTSALDKSCSATLLVRTVQSSVKVKTREISTLCPDARRRDDTRPKRKKLSVFPRLTWTKCPARGHVACETDKSVKRDNAEKRERARNEKCCGERRKNA